MRIACYTRTGDCRSIVHPRSNDVSRTTVNEWMSRYRAPGTGSTLGHFLIHFGLPVCHRRRVRVRASLCRIRSRTQHYSAVAHSRWIKRQGARPCAAATYAALRDTTLQIIIYTYAIPHLCLHLHVFNYSRFFHLRVIHSCGSIPVTRLIEINVQ